MSNQRGRSSPSLTHVAPSACQVVRPDGYVALSMRGGDAPVIFDWLQRMVGA